MPITTMDQLLAALPGQRIRFIKGLTTATTVAGQVHTLWDRTGNPSAGSLSIGNTTSGVIPTSATTGAIPFTNASSGKQLYLARVENSPSVSGTLVLYDRVWHAGSFALSSLTTFTLTGQPTLTRPDSVGTGLEIWLEVNAAFSNSATTLQVGYTNSAGASGRLTTTSAALNSFVTGRMIGLARQAGDVGVSKVDSLIVAGATNAAGTVNVVLMRRIAQIQSVSGGFGETQDAFRCGMPPVYNDSCLTFSMIPSSTSSGIHIGSLNLVSD